MNKYLLALILTHQSLAAQVNDELLTVTAPSVIIQSGREALIRIIVDVKEGYHIQAHETKDEFIIPTSLSIPANKEFAVTMLQFPSPKQFRLQGTDQSLDVYDGKFEVIISVRASEAARKQLYHLPVELTYQACDSAHCLFPRVKKFTATIDVH